MAIGGIVFAVVFGSALLAMFVRSALPEDHLSADSKDVVKLGIALIATMSALVLGLLIASAKSAFDTRSNQLVQASADIILLDRAWIATVLTAQVAAGAALGIAAQAFLALVIIGYVMPFFGLELLDMAREVAAFNLPARVGQLFGVSL